MKTCRCPSADFNIKPCSNLIKLETHFMPCYCRFGLSSLAQSLNLFMFSRSVSLLMIGYWWWAKPQNNYHLSNGSDVGCTNKTTIITVRSLQSYIISELIWWWQNSTKPHIMGFTSKDKTRKPFLCVSLFLIKLIYQ